MVGGMVSEGRWCCWPPRLCVVYPLCLCGGPVEWREGGLCVVPVFGLGPPTLCCLHFPSVCVLPCLLWVGKCGGVRWCAVVELSRSVLLLSLVFAVTALLV